jgi:CheY-like chemotaxis protein
MDEKLHILIIDDSAVVLDRVRSRLIAEGWEVMTTTQTVGAAKYLVHCDLVLIDFHMPGMDGGTVVTSLRGASKRTGGAPLFYVYTSDEEKAAAFRRYGFDGAFTKKGDDSALVQQISALFRMKKLRQLSRGRLSRPPEE